VIFDSSCFVAGEEVVGVVDEMEDGPEEVSLKSFGLR
jgi:hypothetical protein